MIMIELTHPELCKSPKTAHQHANPLAEAAALSGCIVKDPP